MLLTEQIQEKLPPAIIQPEILAQEQQQTKVSNDGVTAMGRALLGLSAGKSLRITKSYFA